MAVQNVQLRHQLITAYKKLTPLQQSVVQVLSVIYEKVTLTDLITCLRKLGIRHLNNKSFTFDILDPFLYQLTTSGVIQKADKGRIYCNRLFVELATREAIYENRFDEIATVVQQVIPYPEKCQQMMRDFRISFYMQDIESVREQIKHYSDPFSNRHPYVSICSNPMDEAWFMSLPEAFIEDILVAMMNDAISRLEARPKHFALLQKYSTSSPTNQLKLTLAEQWIVRGDFTEAKKLIANQELPEMLALQGWLDFLANQNKSAISHFESALRLMKEKDKNNHEISTCAWIFYILALVQTNVPENLDKAQQYIMFLFDAQPTLLHNTYKNLRWFIAAQQGSVNAAKVCNNIKIPIELTHVFANLIDILVLVWMDNDSTKHAVGFLNTLYKKAEQSDYHWLATEIAVLLSKLKKNSYMQKAKKFCQTNHVHTIVDLIQPMEDWQRTLNALIKLEKTGKKENDSTSSSRLVWFLTLNKTAYSSSIVLQPREQRITAKGTWSKGRPIALKRLYHNRDDFDFLSSQDIEICSFIREERENTNYYPQTYYNFSTTVLPALIGHPFVFWADSAKQAELVEGTPELQITKQKNDKLAISFSHPIDSQTGIQFFKETPTRVKLLQVTKDHVQILEVMGKTLEVPAKAKPQVLQAINTLSSMVTLHSEIGASVDNLDTVKADALPHFHLLPFGVGLKISLLVQPFATEGPYYQPGVGGEIVIAEINAKRIQTKRLLQQEKKLANAVIAACPTLNNLETIDNEWLIDDTESCLEILLEIQALGKKAVIEWPEGEKLSIRQQASLNQFHINITQKKDWFSLIGELKLNDELILGMQQLLEMVETGTNRFVRIEEGQFIALTQSFYKQLQKLKRYAETSDKGVRVHPLATMALEELTESAGSLRSDKHWKAHIKRLRTAQEFQPILPSTYQAELRDYQLDGFNWLSRLAQWGVGACLADDMGLGKTIQALAVMLNYAPHGVCLVVAPLSVCMNWEVEAQRFAPTLNCILFGGGDRQDMLDKLQPFDLLICSYGLLQQEQVAEMLAKVHFQMIVLDEAQAIKNFATKRSQAAMNLHGEFKLITTGTPIENHLGEFWNLFRFINPGLLGSLEHFNQRYAGPIEKNHDKEASKHLRKLIQPFILRRTKNQVLEELPPRTEILLQVELSSEEIAFYETLRRQAVEKLTSNEKRPSGQKHLQILAEIMKLRRACCNSQLVVPNISLASSKLKVFGDLLEELLDNNHKALVFSQFVDHLKIIRDHLDKNHVTYQYLDGSTSAKERKNRVAAFQAGKGDVFLISLKAGGTGLNLTAADYVIHMDPWWNPAVEDQASDRAHRIGQQRPVTIYRLVAQQTIEEKIVALHHQKRNLAESLLEGSDMSGKISIDELLRLISEE